jgi:hypothetical protein
MDYSTIGELRKHYEIIEERYQQGSIIPSSAEGMAIRDQILVAIKDLGNIILEEHHYAKGGQIDALDRIIDLVDVRHRLALLLGKFEGFRYGQTYFVVRAPSGSQYLV